ncbi:SGS-domain-containing protein [Sistotremastrum niveocremeum HHB9708]|uniref:SGS-domain-containing protein n=1 Tax=Sistotremastrum niveocremeum HHB9708 TaxID=1314777 RepID=A0A164XIF4_9AGAM|nr:SGS-domain-containing protein [Sistotremastrum niveocremeum HHB9708]
MSATPRHEFYETDERLTLSIFDKGADPAEVSVVFTPDSLTYKHGEKELHLEPLAGTIDPSKSEYTVGKVKVEVRLHKVPESQGRWAKLTRDHAEAPKVAVTNSIKVEPTPSSSVASGFGAKPRKNWDKVTSTILEGSKEKTTEEDPNAGGDTAVNGFFQKLFADADDDTKRAMMKSFSESGGTTLSTNWAEVGKEKVTVKPPEGSEWKRWG